MNFNLLSFSGLLITITSLVLIVILLIYGKTQLHRLWMLFNFFVIFWGFSLFMIGSTNYISSAQIWWKVASTAGGLLAPLLFHIVCIFCNLNKKKLICVFYLQILIFILLDYFNLATYRLEFIFNSFYYLHPTGVVLPLFLIFWALIITYSFYELTKFYKKSQGLKRYQTLYIFIGLSFGFIGGGTHLLTVFSPSLIGRDIYPFGQLGVAVYCIIATYAILRYRLMDIRVAGARAGIFFVVYALVLGIPFWLGFRLLGKGLWIIPVSFAVVLATLGPFIYRLLHKRAEDVLLAEQKRYQKLLLQAASGMVEERNLGKLAKLIVYIVKRSVKISFAAIFIDDKQDGVYRLKAVRDSGQVFSKEVTFLYEYPFVEYLKKHKDPLLYEELPKDMRRALGTLYGVNLIIPSVTKDTLLGFVLLGEKSSHQPYTKDDLDVFKTLSHQAALAISYCLFLEEFQKAQEKIFTAEKLSSIGGMADGVAHQIKNRLNHFSVAAGELKYGIKDLIEKQSQFIAKNPELKKALDYYLSIADSIVGNVKKTDGIIGSILKFARVEENAQFFGEFSLKEVIANAVELAQVKHEISQFPLKLHLGAADIIYGIKAQLLEIIYNILDNAYEAIKEKQAYYLREKKEIPFKPSIELSLSCEDDFYLISVSDNGMGIKEEDKKKIFAPFFTTKSSYKSGSGIGAYIVKRIIEENHQGKIWFESEYTQGTTFSIKLPKKGRKI